MVNGYGIFLIAWLFAQFVSKVHKYYKTEENPGSCAIGAAIQLTIVIWLIFQI